MIENFGRNIRFQPKHIAEPKSEQELLQFLAENPRRRFRVVGARHSWSALIPTDDVSVNLRHLDSIRLTTRSNGRVMVSAGAGCTIDHLLRVLDRHGLTLPTVGQIRSQTIGGAIATATHGSGRYSLSHYLKGVRIAVFDPETGKPAVRLIERGPDMAAARCSLGCLGIILEVRFYCVPQFQVTENIIEVDSLEEVLRLEHRCPLQQFYLIPHTGRICVAARRPARDGERTPRPVLWMRRSWRFVTVGLFMHLMIVLMARIRPGRRIVQAFYRRIFPRLFLRKKDFTDTAYRVLTEPQERFTHYASELYVPESAIRDAVPFVQAAIDAFANRDGPVPALFATKIAEADLTERLHQLRGTWVHHYMICVRKVLPDDSLLSMSAGSEPYYAFSFVTYDRDRWAFRGFSSFLSQAMAAAFGARPHWGMHIDLRPEEIARLYPKFDRFRRIRRRFDRRGQFSNAMIAELMKVPESDSRPAVEVPEAG